MKTSEVRALIGKCVQWEESHDRHRGTHIERTGIVDDVKGKNVLMRDGDWLWIPNLINLKERSKP